MSLAITEKKEQHHHRGCASVFFKLWEWNRRLARRKLFLKKLLPPARPAKKASEMFGIDEKMPAAKLLLIAEENREGFPTAKKPEPGAGPESWTRAPGLMARLMGLESLPVSTPETPDDDVECAARMCRRACGKVERRPPKLQKNEVVLPDQRTTEQAAEQRCPYRMNAPPKSRAGNKHQKLASPPAKSPRLLAGSPRARLMQAATKILDPRVQSRNVARRGVGYVESSVANAGANPDAIATGKSEQPLDGSDSKSSVKLDEFVGKFQSGMQKKGRFSSNDGSSCSSVSKISGSRMNSCPQTGISLQNKLSEFKEKKCLIGNNQNLFKHRLHSASRNNLKQTQTAAVRDKLAFGSKVCIRRLTVKDENEPILGRSSVPREKDLNNHAGIKTCGVTDMQKVNLEKDMACKGAITGSRNELFPALSSTLAKEESIGNCSIIGKGQVFTGHQVMTKRSIRNVSKKRVKGDCSSDTGKSIASLTFNSPIRHSTTPFLCEAMTERATVTNELHHDASLKRPPMDIKNNNLPLKRRIRLAADDQSAVIQKKIGNVTSVCWNELQTRNTLTAASILQELIAALIAGDPIPGQNGIGAGCTLETTDSSSHSQDLFNFSILRSQVLNVKKASLESKLGSSGAFLLTKDDHPSPISILEASFSNDSCSYRSLDASSEGKPADSWSTSESSEMDPDILDSATSVDIRKSDLKILSYSSESHCSISVHSCEFGQPKYEFHEAAQAVSNAANLLEKFIFLTGSDGIREEFSLESFLRDTLGVILNAIQLQRSCSYKEARAAHMFKQCLFDCIIQCLDSNYRSLCRSGYKNLSKLSPVLTLEQLRREVHEQISRWVDLAGKFSVELIENEMDHSTGRWADCGDEAFEAGKEIARDILEALVSDMVLDFRL